MGNKITELKIRADNGMWYFKINGKTKYLSKTLSKEEAQQAYAKFVLQNQTSANDGSRPWDHTPISEVIPLYTDEMTKTGVWATSTARIMRQTLNEISLSLGTHTMSGLTRDEIKAWMNREAWNPSTRAKRLKALKALYRWALRERKITDNVTETLECPKSLRRGEEHVIYEDEWARLRPVLHPHARIICDVLWATGARPTEILTVTAEEYFPSAKQIRKQWHKNKNKGKDRTIFLDTHANEIVRDAHSRRTTGLLFPGALGGAWDASYLSQEVAKARDEVGLRSQITPYSFRHAYICRKILQRVPLGILSDMVGNSVAVIQSNYQSTLKMVSQLTDCIEPPTLPFVR